MELSFDLETRVQKHIRPLQIQNASLIYVCVAIAMPGTDVRDRFFILTKAQLQEICIRNYTDWMEPYGWRRPKNPESYDCRYYLSNLEVHENKWERIIDRLAESNPEGALEVGED